MRCADSTERAIAKQTALPTVFAKKSMATAASGVSRYTHAAARSISAKGMPLTVTAVDSTACSATPCQGLA